MRRAPAFAFASGELLSARISGDMRTVAACSYPRCLRFSRSASGIFSRYFASRSRDAARTSGRFEYSRTAASWRAFSSGSALVAANEQTRHRPVLDWRVIGDEQSEQAREAGRKGPSAEPGSTGTALLSASIVISVAGFSA